MSYIPLKLENLDCTSFTNDRGDTYVSIGEHFVASKGDHAGEWRQGQRSFSVNLSDPESRKLLVGFLNHVGATVGALLKATPVNVTRVAPSHTRASWVSEMELPDPRRNGPVTTTKPAVDPGAADLLQTLKGR